MVCRLVMLIKNAGVQPIDTGQGLGRIMGKVVMIIFKKDVAEVAGPSQSCISWLWSRSLCSQKNLLKIRCRRSIKSACHQCL